MGETHWLLAAIDHAQKMQNWHTAYALCTTMEEEWAVLRKMYAFYMPRILAASQRHPRGRIDPNFVPWRFSPIEAIAWDKIRVFGTPLYPQVPVDGAFLDFANPYFKIGIELDGKDYHDPQQDSQRDARLRRQGWTIFRITGAEAYASLRIRDTDDLLHMMDTSDGLITAIDYIYFRPEPERWPWYSHALQCLAFHTTDRVLRRQWLLMPVTRYARDEEMEYDPEEEILD